MSVKTDKYVMLYNRTKECGPIPAEYSEEFLNEMKRCGEKFFHVEDITLEDAEQWIEEFDEKGKKRMDELVAKAKKTVLLDYLGELKYLYALEEDKEDMCTIYIAAKHIHQRGEVSKKGFEDSFPGVSLNDLVDYTPHPYEAHLPEPQDYSKEIEKLTKKIQNYSDIKFNFHKEEFEGASMNYFEGWEELIDSLNMRCCEDYHKCNGLSIEKNTRESKDFIDIYSRSGYHTTDALEKLVELKPIVGMNDGS